MLHRSLNALSCCLLIILTLASAASADWQGKVVGVTDGDTLTVLSKGKPERIRLNGIDCPEKRQAFGKHAKQFASRLTYGKEVTVKDHGQDRYGLIIADAVLPDGRVLNEELIKAGMCWWYRKYAPDNGRLEQLEREAREAKRGLWAEPEPIPPWEWRIARKRYR